MIFYGYHLQYAWHTGLGLICNPYQMNIITACCILLPLHYLFMVLLFGLFGCYRGVWRFASLPDLWRILRAVSAGALIISVVLFLYSRFEGVPRSAIILYPVLLFIGVSTSRVIYRVIKTHHFALEKNDHDRALVVGAGQAGQCFDSRPARK